MLKTDAFSGIYDLCSIEWKWKHEWCSKDCSLLNEGQLRGGEVVLDLRCCFPNVIKLSFSRGQKESFQLFPLFEAKLCMQNEFIIWGSASQREKGTKSYSWRGWTFLYPLKGTSKPKRQVLTLQRAVYIAGGDLHMSITQHISGSSCQFPEQHSQPAVVAGVPISALWLFISQDHTAI